MRPFRFRADVALQLRRREHDQALVLQSRAQRALTLAQNAVDEAAAAVAEADARLQQAVQTPPSNVPLDWYRSWRLRCTAERERLAQERQQRAGEMHAATRHVFDTHKRVRSLELLQDSARATWQRAAAQEEQKTMDALAASRFTRRKDI